MKKQFKQKYAGAARKQKRRSIFSVIIYIIIFILATIFAHFFLSEKFPNMSMSLRVVVSFLLGLILPFILIYPETGLPGIK